LVRQELSPMFGLFTSVINDLIKHQDISSSQNHRGGSGLNVWRKIFPTFWLMKFLFSLTDITPPRWI
jgi:hypothetical protein